MYSIQSLHDRLATLDLSDELACYQLRLELQRQRELYDSARAAIDARDRYLAALEQDTRLAALCGFGVQHG